MIMLTTHRKCIWYCWQKVVSFYDDDDNDDDDNDDDDNDDDNDDDDDQDHDGDDVNGDGIASAAADEGPAFIPLDSPFVTQLPPIGCTSFVVIIMGIMMMMIFMMKLMTMIMGIMGIMTMMMIMMVGVVSTVLMMRVMKYDGDEIQVKLLKMMIMRRVRMRVVFEMVILSPWKGGGEYRAG